MKSAISWTLKEEDGVKREVRVTFSSNALKWQFKRADEERWDYDHNPETRDWDELEALLRRKAARGRSVNKLEAVVKMRAKMGV